MFPGFGFILDLFNRTASILDLVFMRRNELVDIDTTKMRTPISMIHDEGPVAAELVRQIASV